MDAQPTTWPPQSGLNKDKVMNKILVENWQCATYVAWSQAVHRKQVVTMTKLKSDHL